MAVDEGDPGTVTNCIGRLKDGDSSAAQDLWERYFARLVGLARLKLRGTGVVENEEDAALSAFGSFCLNLKGGRFPSLTDREDLWRLLVEITTCKAYDQLERRRRKKRGGECLFEAAEFDQLVSSEPTGEFVCEASEQCDALMLALGEPDLRLIAWMKMDGYTREEISKSIGCHEKTVANKLKLIRLIWLDAGLATAAGEPAE